MATAQAESHQDDQASLTLILLALLARLWPSFNPDDVEGTLPTFRDLVGALVQTYGRASGAVAGDFYRAQRLDAGISGRISLPPVPDVPEGFIDSALVEALSAPPELQQAALDSAVEQLVLDRGREQLLFAVRTDDQAKGWARVVHEGACSFCLMLALRAGAGLLYDSRESASFLAHHMQPNGSGGDCRCSVEPVFTLPYEPSARVREAQQLWDDTAALEDEEGLLRSGKDLRTAFRQAVEGRKITGQRATKDKATGEVKKPQRHVAAKGKTPENQQHQLDLLLALPDAKTPEAAQWRVTRIAEIRKYLGKQ